MLAPTSSTNTGLPGSLVGNRAPIAGRSMPFSRPSRKIAEAITAPELPAEYTASASPFFTRSMATLMLASRLRRTAVASSSMPMEGPLATRSRCPAARALSKASRRPRLLAAAITRSISPTKRIFSGSRSMASRHPSRIGPGAWSPPMPSTATQRRSASSISSASVPPCSQRRGSNPSGWSTLLATVPAPETTVSATLPAIEPAAVAELAAPSTMVVTAALRRYQITRRRIARGRFVLCRG